jgi:DNA-binding NarL/FixJ family response regulator
MRVVIVAEDARTAEGIRNVLPQAPACEVLGYVEPAHVPVGALREALPDLVLIDGSRDGRDPERVRRLRSAVPGTTLVLLTDDTASEHLIQARSAGVDAILSKECSDSSIGLLIRELAAGRMYLGYQPPRRQAPAPERLALSARELELIRLAVSGEPNRTIARHLWVTEATVARELFALSGKLGVSSTTEMAHYAHAQGIVDATDATSNIAATPLAAVA